MSVIDLTGIGQSHQRTYEPLDRLHLPCCWTVPMARTALNELRYVLTAPLQQQDLRNSAPLHSLTAYASGRLIVETGNARKQQRISLLSLNNKLALSRLFMLCHGCTAAGLRGAHLRGQSWTSVWGGLCP